MRRASMMSGLVLAGIVGCGGVTGGVGFGPFPSSSFAGGQLTAGVAGFIPGTVPGEGEFSLLIVNTDSTAGYMVTVTPVGGIAIDRTVAPCSVATAAVPCDAATVQIDLLVAGAAAPVTYTLTPVVGSCTQRVVYIEVPVQTGTPDPNQPAPTPTLTETLPASAANCGLTNLPSLPAIP